MGKRRVPLAALVGLVEAEDGLSASLQRLAPVLGSRPMSSESGVTCLARQPSLDHLITAAFGHAESSTAMPIDSMSSVCNESREASCSLSRSVDSVGHPSFGAGSVQRCKCK